MVKRILLALLVLVAFPALAAVETTTINFTVVTPSGATATSGTVLATLSTSGETPDGVSTAVVAARTSATIASNGAVALALVPNDAITPEGTYYTFSYNVKTPTLASWTERRSVATTPDPALISNTTLLTTVPGIVPPVSRIQDEATSLTRRPSLNMTGAGVTCVDNAANGRTDCTISGSGIPGGSSQNVQVNNSSAFGYAPGFVADTSTGNVTLKTLDGEGSVRAYDYTGDGAVDTVPSRISAHIQARAHAMIYSPLPELYLEGGVVDVWTDIAHNRGPLNLAQSSEFSQTVVDCVPAGCATLTQTLCTSGASSFGVGELFLVGNSRTHIVQSVSNGTGATCPSGTNNEVVFSPALQSDEGLTAGGTIKSLWRNSSHFSNTGIQLLGYKVGMAPLARDGKHGPDALANGAADYDSPLMDWEVVGTATVAGNNWNASSGTGAYDCVEGTLSSSCTYITGGGATDILRTPKYPRAIDVRPGERWVLSGVVTLQSGTFTVSLEADINRDGTMETYLPVTSATGDPSKTVPGWFWSTFTIPAGVHQVRVRFTRSTTGSMQVDGFSFRRAALLADDTDQTAPVSYLINDPGSRSIVVTGDSWAATNGGTALGDYLADGLTAALLARTGRDLSSQITVSGKSGITLSNLLSGNACTTTSGSGGALNCWYESIEQYKPLYVVVAIGTNDVFAGSPPTAAAFAANIQTLRGRIRSIGAIPIIIGVAPVGGTVGVGSQYDIAHNYYDAERKAVLDSGYGDGSISSGIEHESQTVVTSAPVLTAPKITGRIVVNGGGSTNSVPSWAAAGVSCSTACTNTGATSCADSVPLDGTNTPLGNCSSTTGLRLCECY